MKSQTIVHWGKGRIDKIPFVSQVKKDKVSTLLEDVKKQSKKLKDIRSKNQKLAEPRDIKEHTESDELYTEDRSLLRKELSPTAYSVNEIEQLKREVSEIEFIDKPSPSEPGEEVIVIIQIPRSSGELEKRIEREKLAEKGTETENHGEVCDEELEKKILEFETGIRELVRKVETHNERHFKKDKEFENEKNKLNLTIHSLEEELKWSISWRKNRLFFILCLLSLLVNIYVLVKYLASKSSGPSRIRSKKNL